jgi:hypothetical protein
MRLTSINALQIASPAAPRRILNTPRRSTPPASQQVAQPPPLRASS